MVIDEMPADTPNALDGGVTGEALYRSSREIFNGPNEVFADGRNGKGGTRINDDRDAVWRAGICLERATMWENITGCVVGVAS